MHRPQIRRSSVVTVAAAAALVVATGGTSAYAAHLITSKQIKDNTIKSIDVRNGTLTTADLAPGTIPAPYGGTSAWSTYHDGAVAVGTTNTTILTLDVPSAGSYVANAVTGMTNGGASEAFVSCSLVADGDNDVKSVYVEKSVVDSPNRSGYALQVVHTFGGPGSVKLICSSNLASAVTASNSKITAVKVDHLTNTPG